MSCLLRMIPPRRESLIFKKLFLKTDYKAFWWFFIFIIFEKMSVFGFIPSCWHSVGLIFVTSSWQVIALLPEKRRSSLEVSIWFVDMMIYLPLSFGSINAWSRGFQFLPRWEAVSWIWGSTEAVQRNCPTSAIGGLLYFLFFVFIQHLDCIWICAVPRADAFFPDSFDILFSKKLRDQDWNASLFNGGSHLLAVSYQELLKD